MRGHIAHFQCSKASCGTCDDVNDVVAGVRGCTAWSVGRGFLPHPTSHTSSLSGAYHQCLSGTYVRPKF